MKSSGQVKQEIIDVAGPDIAMVCPHYYQADLDGVDADLRRIEGWIKGSAGRDRIRMGVTEWNVDAGNWGLGRGKLNTLGCALFEARFLNVLHRHSEFVTLACRSNMTNSFQGGTIQTNAAGLYRTPSFLVMRLYRSHSKPLPVRVAADDHRPARQRWVAPHLAGHEEGVHVHVEDPALHGATLSLARWEINRVDSLTD